jgi:hypothetical protein
MRENRLYGSEGGEAQSLPYPYHGSAAADLAAPRLLTPHLLETITTRTVLGTRRRTISWMAGLLRCVRNDGERPSK